MVFQMTQFMDDHIIDYFRTEFDQFGIETYPAARTAAAPPAFHGAYGESRRPESRMTVFSDNLRQSFR